MQFFGALIMLLIAVTTEMFIPWLAKVIIDDVIVPQQFEWQSLVWLLGLIITSYVISSLFTYFQSIWFRHGALKVVKDVRKQLFSHVLNYPIKRFDQEPSGKLVSYITNDTEALREMFMSTIPTVIQGSLRIIAIFIAMALLDWRLMLVSLILLPILLFVMHLYRKISTSVFEGIRAQISNINGRLSESLEGMLLIQAFRQEKNFRDKFEQENSNWFKFRSKSVVIDSLMLLPLTRLISTLTAAGILAWFAGASLTTVIAVGTLYAFLNYIERFFDPFRQLSMELRKLQVATVSSKRIFELLDENIEKDFHSTKTIPLGDQYDIEFRNVSFSYEQNKPALSNVSFTAKTGQYTAIVGHTGSGKSSVINLLMRFYQQQHGDILVAGHPLSSFSEKQLHNIFGLVSQDPIVFNGSVLENIHLSVETPNEKKAIFMAQQVNANKFIENFSEGYHQKLGHGGASLSVGEKQLLTIARTLSNDPNVYLLDEATANIDSESEETVKQALSSIQGGKTVIAVAHRLSTIQNADQILVLNNGKLIQRGNHDELIAQPGDYRDLYLAQQKQEESEYENMALGLAF
jgi:ATP-binding cassette subfamily B protein